MDWQDKFCSMLFPPDNASLKIEEAYDLKFQFLPKSIFKYRVINKNNIKNLINNKIWMSKPDGFNDPYDTGATADYERISLINIKRNFDRYYGSAIERHNIPKNVVDAARASDDPRQVFLFYAVSIGEIKPESASTFEKSLYLAIEEQHKNLEESFSRVSKSHKVIHSFSERNDSILMWSHYADSHKGYSLEYDLDIVPKQNPMSRFMFPVIYSINFFDATDYHIAMGKLAGNALFLTKAALYKSDEWAYEKEWRWIISGGLMQEGLHDFLPPKSIYLGAKILPKDEKKLRKIGREKGIPVKKMHLSGKRFSMEPE